MRLIFHIALVISLLYLPWWAGAVVALSACFLVDRFYEIVVYGIIADAFYGTRFGLYGFGSVATLYTVIVFTLASIVRKRLAW
ncbi:hypothetical protein KW799_00700 [Candidatus Parcubacteria bacterium]|nr:hypothetical protein [Candidatus Parcubacteria bacterium]